MRVTKEPVISGCRTQMPEEDMKCMTFKYRWRETVIYLVQGTVKYQMAWPMKIGQ